MPALLHRAIARPAAAEERLVLPAARAQRTIDDRFVIERDAERGIVPECACAGKPPRVTRGAPQADKLGRGKRAPGINGMMLHRDRRAAPRVIPVAGKIRGRGVERVVSVRPGIEIVCAHFGARAVCGVAGLVKEVERGAKERPDRLLIHRRAVDRPCGQREGVEVAPGIEIKPAHGAVEILFRPGRAVDLDQGGQRKCADRAGRVKARTVEAVRLAEAVFFIEVFAEEVTGAARKGEVIRAVDARAAQEHIAAREGRRAPAEVAELGIPPFAALVRAAGNVEVG